MNMAHGTAQQQSNQEQFGEHRQILNPRPTLNMESMDGRKCNQQNGTDELRRGEGKPQPGVFAKSKRYRSNGSRETGQQRHPTGNISRGWVERAREKNVFAA